MLYLLSYRSAKSLLWQEAWSSTPQHPGYKPDVLPGWAASRFSGGTGRIWTYNQLLTRQLLLSVELRCQFGFTVFFPPLNLWHTGKESNLILLVWSQFGRHDLRCIFHFLTLTPTGLLPGFCTSRRGGTRTPSYVVPGHAVSQLTYSPILSGLH